MKKEAIGIAVNGREVKIAHIHQDKYRLSVDFLESSILASDIDADYKRNHEQAAEVSINTDEDDVFATKNPYENKSPIEKETGSRENIDILYSLLAKFAAKRTKVGFNISPSRVTYQELDTHLDFNKNVFKGNLRKKIENWKQGFNAIDNVSVLSRKDGTACNIACDTYQPPIVNLLDQLNTFFKGNLNLSLMDSNEVALVNLARMSYDFQHSSEITVIVEIETEYSRIIFMKGDDLLLVSPIINESFNPDIISIVYSKIIYELDNSNIPEITNILLAGRASSITAKNFFEKKFPKVRVGFIVSQALAENLSSQFSREELSNYAIPIALAWKLIDNKNKNFIPTNLLSSQIIDRQKVLSLSFSGYVILILLGISTFILTWKITAKKIEVGKIRNANYTLQERINSGEETVKRVNEIEDEIKKLTQRIVLSDSLSYGSDRLLSFLENLNRTVSRSRSVWVEEVQSTQSGILVKGKALKRGDVPKIAEQLGAAKIIKLTRTEYGTRRLFSFEMEVDWKQKPFRPGYKDSSQPARIPPIRTASNPSKQSKTIASDWGSKTTVNQTVVAETEFEQQDRNNSLTTNPVRDNLPVHSKKEKVDRLSNVPIKSDRFQQEKPLVAATPSKMKSQPTTNVAAIKKPKNATSSVNTAPVTNNANSRFTIKISAHANQFTARKEVEYYQSKGFNAYITTLPNSTTDIPYWVCLGDFSSYNEAKAELSRLNRAIPGRRVISEISESNFRNLTAPVMKPTTAKRISLPKSVPQQMIQQAKHTVVAYDSQSQRSKISKPINSQYVTIRISAHVTKFTAQKEVEKFKRKGYSAYITRLPNSSRDIPYSVCLGRFSSVEEAQQKIKKLASIIPGQYDIVAIH